MSSVYKIIQELESTRSKNEKLDILIREKDNVNLREFFRLSLNKFILFYQKKDIAPNTFCDITEMTFTEAMQALVDEISTRKVTGNAAISRISDILAALSDEGDRELIRRILKKDPACGVDTTALKVWKGLYREYPVLLSEAFDQKYWDKYFAGKGPWIAQCKLDGGRCNIVIRGGVVSVMSRAGNELNLHGRFDHLADTYDNMVIDGELVAKKDGKFESRKFSNGLFTKAVKGTISKAESEMMHLIAWDYITIGVFDGKDESEKYEERFAALNLMFKKHAPELISIVESELVSTQEDAMAFYVRMRERGEEGAMLKTTTHKWGDERSKEILKLKNIATCELRVVGSTEGEGVLRGNLGSLELESECGKLSVNCSGFPLQLRSQIWANINNKPVDYVVVDGGMNVTRTVEPNLTTSLNIGSIVEVKYNELIDDKRTGKHSLFLPRFDKERLDKTHANTLEEIAKKGV